MNPTLLILSGMHGDEYEVAGCVKSYLASHTLPPHLYIPEVSPSAVARKTRLNIFGHDVNRGFSDPPQDEEVMKVMEILVAQKFTLAIDFHEDPDLTDAFYIYDSDQLTEDALSQYRAAIQKTGVTLHTGIDDSLDPTLGLRIVDGYISTVNQPSELNAGFAAVWMLQHHIVARYITVEVPGKASIELKQKLVAAIFDTIPLFGT